MVADQRTMTTVYHDVFVNLFYPHYDGHAQERGEDGFPAFDHSLRIADLKYRVGNRDYEQVETGYASYLRFSSGENTPTHYSSLNLNRGATEKKEPFISFQSGSGRRSGNYSVRKFY